jgi:predicted N-acyltransferase
MAVNPESYQLEVIQSLAAITEKEWNALLSPSAGPFIQYAFLQTLEECGCVGEKTGWHVAHLLLKNRVSKIIGAMPLYLKQHSYGEFVFDWAWAEAYAQTGKSYYPKALCAIPFTPVQGSRILIDPQEDQEAVQRVLIAGLKSLVSQNDLSSAHILFSEANDLPDLTAQGFMLRDSVQFHWQNQGFENFEAFLSALNMKRRKNIRRERAQVAVENIQYRHIPGKLAMPEDWSFFYQCYANTYLEHYSTPYLSASFFQKLGERMPENLHLIIASRNGIQIASSLLFVDQLNSKAYGRYWGCLEYIPCLHFETAYYQAIEYCIAEGIQTYEGGAQGQHKMARGFLPTTIQSAHWIADQQFAKAVQHFLEREHLGMTAYVDELAEHSPLKSTTVAS